MVDSKPWSKAPTGIKVLLAALLLSFLWMGNILSGGDAGGQTPQVQPLPPAPISPVEAEKIELKLKVNPPPTPVGSEPLPPQAVPVLVAPQSGPMLTRVGFRSFNSTFKPDTPLKDLLPIPPKTRTGLLLVEDLSQVPEVSFQEPLAKTPEALKITAHTMAKINHLNRQKADGFMEALVGARADLAGLPLAMGDACRMKGDRTQFFSQALATIKRAKGQGGEGVAALQSARLQLMEREIAVRHAQDVALRDKEKKAEMKVLPPVPASPLAGGKTPGRSGGPQPPVVQQLDEIIVAQAIGSSFTVMARNTDPDAFWDQYGKLCAQEDKTNSKLDRSQLEHVTLARIAALMQVLGPESVAMRKGLVKYLAGTSNAEATRALAKLAIFSAEDEVRNPAIEALKVRREKDYTEVLLRGLRYPLPAVARRATEAMVKLERADLVPELVSFLEEPDPRAPILKQIGENKVPVLRELVRINHHRNCVLCHAPAVQGEVPPQVTTAEVPRPDQPLPSPSEGYSNSIPDILVRLDVTYLRQDFSLLQPVADAQPWPEMQRFDFMVRERAVTEQEAAAFPTTKAGALSPYQRATLAALRELTGRDTAPTPEAWRKLLKLPGRDA